MMSVIGIIMIMIYYYSECDECDYDLLAPEASEASKGAFYLFLGFKWLLLCCEKEVTVVC